MSLFTTYRRVLSVALIAAVASMGWAAEAGRPEAVDAARAASAQKLVEQATAQRERMLADHAALTKQLKTATEEQRKAILARLEEQRKAFEESQRTLAKLIRDEQRRQRQETASPRR
jgi:spore cortex formation protein SpoVR/YcgB (stage V sporulation)